MLPLLLTLLALDMGGASRDLARNLAAAAAHDSVILTVRNQSTSGAAETAEIRRVIESDLRSAGARLVDAPPATEIRLTISENLTHILIVAELHRNGEREVFVDSWPRPPSVPAIRPAQVTLERKLLYEQDQPILDVAQTGTALLVLDAARLLLVRGADRQSLPIPATHPWPRDMRGRLAVSPPSYTAWLPGMICRGSIDPQLSVDCNESQEPWPLAPGAFAPFAPNRNYFAGRVDIEGRGAHDVPPFYSTAPIADAWIFAGADGHARIYQRTWEPAGMIENWGSDLASVDTPCGPRILVTRANGPDAIGPYEFAIGPHEFIGGAARAAGPALEFNGPVIALWSTGGSAVAISHDSETGRYAAYSLALHCGN